MRKVLSLTVITFLLLSSCTNVMDEKISTKHWEDFKTALLKIDTIDVVEKEFILKDGNEMIIKAGVAELAMSAIGLKRDTTEIQTFGEYYNLTSRIWKRRNSIEIANMNRNILIDSGLLVMDFIDISVNPIDVVDVKSHSMVDNYYYSFTWILELKFLIKGTVKVSTNIKNLHSFTSDYDLSLFGSPIFERVSDSTFEFSKVYKGTDYLTYSTFPILPELTDISKSDLEYYYNNNYLPSSNKDAFCSEAAKSRQQMLRGRYNIIEGKFNRLSTTSNYPKGTKRPNIEFLTKKEQKEFEKE